MTENRRHAVTGILLLALVAVLTVLFVKSPRITAEVIMRFASSAAETEEDPDMAELLMLLNGE